MQVYGIRSGASGERILVPPGSAGPSARVVVVGLGDEVRRDLQGRLARLLRVALHVLEEHHRRRAA